jgi:hypothetical protein
MLAATSKGSGSGKAILRLKSARALLMPVQTMASTTMSSNLLIWLLRKPWKRP